MAVIWSKVPDNVLEIAHNIIVEHHPLLLNFNIGFIFRSEVGTAGGKIVLVQALKVSAKLAPVLDLDALIGIAEDVWYSLKPESKRALIDHELCHLSVSPDGSLSIRGHDIEEFNEIIERYGFWNTDLIATGASFSRANEQLRLPVIPETHTGQLIALEPAVMNN